jgi:hypothetical protein
MTQAVTGAVKNASLAAAGKVNDSLGATSFKNLGEYRVKSVEEAVANYENHENKFWEHLASFRATMKKRAEGASIPEQDLVKEMKPNGKFAGLLDEFLTEINRNPEAQNEKKAMDKALESYANKRERAADEAKHEIAYEDLLSADKRGPNKSFEKLMDRLDAADKRMSKAAGEVPQLALGESSHSEKIQAIMERIKEIIQDFVASLKNAWKGKSSDATSQP